MIEYGWGLGEIWGFGAFFNILKDLRGSIKNQILWKSLPYNSVVWSWNRRSITKHVLSYCWTILQMSLIKIQIYHYYTSWHTEHPQTPTFLSTLKKLHLKAREFRVCSHICVWFIMLSALIAENMKKGSGANNKMCNFLVFFISVI